MLLNRLWRADCRWALHSGKLRLGATL